MGKEIKCKVFTVNVGDDERAWRALEGAINEWLDKNKSIEIETAVLFPTSPYTNLGAIVVFYSQR